MKNWTKGQWLAALCALGLGLALLLAAPHLLRPAAYERDPAALERVIRWERLKEEGAWKQVHIFQTVSLEGHLLAAYRSEETHPRMGVWVFRELPDGRLGRPEKGQTLLSEGVSHGHGLWEYVWSAWDRETAQHMIYWLLLSDGLDISLVEWQVDGAAYEIPVGEFAALTALRCVPFPREQLADLEAAGYGPKEIQPREKGPLLGLSYSAADGVNHEFAYYAGTVDHILLGRDDPAP